MFPPSASLVTLFRINALDRFPREQQVRSKCLFLFPPTLCLHLVLVSITLAPVRLTGRRRRQRTFTSRADFRSRARNRYETPRPATRTLSERLRSLLGRSAENRPEETLPLGPLTRTIDSLDRSPRTFPPLDVHTGSRDVSSFPLALVLAFRKRKKERGKWSEKI